MAPRGTDSSYHSSANPCHCLPPTPTFASPTPHFSHSLPLFYLAYSPYTECFKVLPCLPTYSSTFPAVSLLGQGQTVYRWFLIHPCASNQRIPRPPPPHTNHYFLKTASLSFDDWKSLSSCISAKVLGVTLPTVSVSLLNAIFTNELDGAFWS